MQSVCRQVQANIVAIHKFIVLNKQLARTRRAGTLAILARLAVCAGVETGTAVVVVGPQAHTSPGGRVFATQVKACRRPGVFPFRRVTADRRTYTVKCRFKSTPALHSGTSYPPCTGTWSRRSGRRWPLHSGRLGRSRRSEQHWWLCPHKCLHSPRCLQRMEASHTRRVCTTPQASRRPHLQSKPLLRLYAPGEQEHVLSWQLLPSPQTFPHPPQLLLSVVVSTHAQVAGSSSSPHSDRSAAHTEGWTPRAFHFPGFVPCRPTHFIQQNNTVHAGDNCTGQNRLINKRKKEFA